MNENIEIFAKKKKKKKVRFKRPGASAGIITTATYLLNKIDVSGDQMTESSEANTITTIERTDNAEEESSTAAAVTMDVLKSEKGETDGLMNVGKCHYAQAHLAECRLGTDETNISASVLSAGAHCEYGLNNSAGVNASLVRAEGNIGPITVGTGINFSTNASIGVNGVEATVLGTGFSIGPKIAVKTPFVDLSLNLF